MSIDITTKDLDLQTVELLPARAALGGGLGGGWKIANIHAVNLAAASGLTLVGFLREQHCNIYSNPDRLGLRA